MKTEATYQAVMSSPLMTTELQQIYWVMWSPQLRGQSVESLTKAEIVQALEMQGMHNNPGAPWEKAVPALVKMGLLKKGNKRHCTVKNKEEVTWLLTDSSTPLKPMAPKPSAKQYVKSIAQLEAIIAHHDAHGDGFITPELRKLYEWVRDKVPTPKTSGQR